jgi:hypothetical protein
MRKVHTLIALGALAAVGSLMVGRGAAQNQSGMPDLVGALKKTPGVLGVDAAKTMSGKNVIFAWFENKKAVLEWYNSPVHQGAMKMFGGQGAARKPLEMVKDDSGPLLVIASITMSDKPKFKESSLPISQIAIELYQPVPGGAALGGRFAPESVKVKNLVDYTPAEAGAKP